MGEPRASCGTCVHRYGFLTPERQCAHPAAALGGTIPVKGRPDWCPGYKADLHAAVVAAVADLTEERLAEMEARAKDGATAAWVFGPDAARDALALVAEVRRLRGLLIEDVFGMPRCRLCGPTSFGRGGARVIHESTCPLRRKEPTR